MNRIELKLCDTQGRLFEKSFDEGYDSESFIRSFMNSSVAENLDSTYNRMQWAGEEYLMEELRSEFNFKKSSQPYAKEVLFWIGYIYRYWHLYTGESSKTILRIAPVRTMRRNYMMFHTVAPEMAVEDLREIYVQKQSEVEEE